MAKRNAMRHEVARAALPTQTLRLRRPLGCSFPLARIAQPSARAAPARTVATPKWSPGWPASAALSPTLAGPGKVLRGAADLRLMRVGEPLARHVANHAALHAVRVGLRRQRDGSQGVGRGCPRLPEARGALAA
eukprot:2008054-Alexandrium_andersonii.AAC.1